MNNALMQFADKAGITVRWSRSFRVWWVRVPNTAKPLEFKNAGQVEQFIRKQEQSCKAT